jgi:hypothetical protein
MVGGNKTAPKSSSLGSKSGSRQEKTLSVEREKGRMGESEESLFVEQDGSALVVQGGFPLVEQESSMVGQEESVSGQADGDKGDDEPAKKIRRTPASKIDTSCAKTYQGPFVEGKPGDLRPICIRFTANNHDRLR